MVFLTNIIEGVNYNENVLWCWVVGSKGNCNKDRNERMHNYIIGLKKDFYEMGKVLRSNVAAKVEVGTILQNFFPP